MEGSLTYQRLKEDVAEIRKVAKSDPALATEEDGKSRNGFIINCRPLYAHGETYAPESQQKIPLPKGAFVLLLLRRHETGNDSGPCATQSMLSPWLLAGGIRVPVVQSMQQRNLKTRHDFWPVLDAS